MKYFAALIVFSLTLLLAGCQTGKVNFADRLSSNIVTNDVPVVHTFTNTVLVPTVVFVTNREVQFVDRPVLTIVTNDTGITIQTNLIQIVQTNVTVMQTNILAAQTTISSETNTVKVAQLVDKPSADAAVGAVSALGGNMVGMGLLASTVALGLLHGYQTRRNKQLLAAATGQSTTKDAIIATTMQGMETLQEVLKITPQGQQASNVVTQFLLKHQAEAGVVQQITDLMAANVDNPAAKEAAKLITDQIKLATPATIVAATPGPLRPGSPMAQPAPTV